MKTKRSLTLDVELESVWTGEIPPHVAERRKKDIQALARKLAQDKIDKQGHDDAVVKIVDTEHWLDVLRSIRRYRACCREVFAVAMLAETAGADVEDREDGDFRITPRHDRSKAVLAALMEKDGKAHLYQVRQYVREVLFPTSRSFVWDSIRREVSARLRSKDPQHRNATREWLGLQGARAFARFNRIGIAFPQSSDPKKKFASQAKVDGHRITLTWDAILGPVHFHLLTMDPGRWRTWQRVIDGAYDIGTIYLNEHKGRVKLTVTYQKPTRSEEVYREHVASLKVAGNDLVIAGAVEDTVSMDHAIGALERFRARKQNLEARRASCGNSRAPWGFRQGWRMDQDVLSAVTFRRSNYVKDQNHAWTRRIASRLLKSHCGTVEVRIPNKLEIAGHSWNWSQFKMFLEYKVGEIGGNVIVVKDDPAEAEEEI